MEEEEKDLWVVTDETASAADVEAASFRKRGGREGGREG